MRKKLKRGLRMSRYVIYRETMIDAREQIWSALGALVGIGIIAAIQSSGFSRFEHIFLIGSFGASGVLIYGAIQSPLAQPRNLVGGHVISAFIGVSVCKVLPDVIWITAPLAVALSIVAMQVTKTLHPPGGATALIAVSGAEKITALGYWYVLSPVLSGTLILLIVALIFNNLTPHRKYPTGKQFIRAFRKRPGPNPNAGPKEEAGIQ